MKLDASELARISRIRRPKHKSRFGRSVGHKRPYLNRTLSPTLQTRFISPSTCCALVSQSLNLCYSPWFPHSYLSSLFPFLLCYAPQHSFLFRTPHLPIMLSPMCMSMGLVTFPRMITLAYNTILPVTLVHLFSRCRMLASCSIFQATRCSWLETFIPWLHPWLSTHLHSDAPEIIIVVPRWPLINSLMERWSFKWAILSGIFWTQMPLSLQMALCTFSPLPTMKSQSTSEILLRLWWICTQIRMNCVVCPVNQQASQCAKRSKKWRPVLRSRTMFAGRKWRQSRVSVILSFSPIIDAFHFLSHLANFLTER